MEHIPKWVIASSTPTKMVMPLISEKTVQISGNGSMEVEREETVVVEMPQGIDFLRLFEDEIDKLRAPFVSSILHLLIQID
ncbi:hypothetical protein RHMOL_Rhmol04G0333000 [Rhododendron molle]|uniref:Uncharacterized protein n=1 Tax=Rhododendron molle TaxID=49168 RepID=A0ACC0P875_RHOML|nr:hypothetical protein RHMOL_Rhmol04G0333000 [Rhododendron molle]